MQMFREYFPGYQRLMHQPGSPLIVQIREAAFEGVLAQDFLGYGAAAWTAQNQIPSEVPMNHSNRYKGLCYR